MAWCLVKQRVRLHGVILMQRDKFSFAFIRLGYESYDGKDVPVFLTEHHSKKEYCGVGVQLHAFLTLAVDGDEWSASLSGPLTTREGAPGTRWIGGWVDPKERGPNY
jgi:hypothetical protein